MASGVYELLALLMRYVFVLIGALILLRAYRWMRRDARDYRRLMRSLPDAGLVGEVVNLRTGKSQPLPREGDIGSSHECDICVRGAGVMRHHVRFAFEEGKGVLVTPSRRGKTLLAGEPLRAPRYALHGTQLQIGSVLLRMRLFAGLKVPQPAAYQAEYPPETPEPDMDLTESVPAPNDLPPSVMDADAGCPAPFDFGQDQPSCAWQPSAVPPPQTAVPAADYDGHYTEDGQMTWRYAYSLEELYRAQEALRNPPPVEHEENDEALPYQSPLPRRRRRDRR